jgi:C4-dicarboxylate-specific signal transduction histidine kinase
MTTRAPRIRWLSRHSSARKGGAVVTRTDITARRRAEQEIEEQRRTLSHLSRVGLLGQLSGAFAHELNQPLTAIRSNAETALLLLRRSPADGEDLAVILRDIVAADERAAAVIHRLRSLLKRGDRRFQPVDAAELIAEVTALARAELIARRIDLMTTVSPRLPQLWGDKVQLQQVLLNFILNACEAMAGKPESSRQLHVTASAEGGRVHVCVRDYGTGIAPDLIPRLFEPLVTTKAEGLGMGLSISRTIVTAHGGRLWAENNADGGATMHCAIPSMAAAVVPSPGATAPVQTGYEQR